MVSELRVSCKKCGHLNAKPAVFFEASVLECEKCHKKFIRDYWLYIRREWIEPISFAIIFALLIKRLLFEIYVIPTSSMEPTLHGANHYPEDGGDKVLVNKFYYRFYDPKNFEVVVFDAPEQGRNQLFIKRLIGLPNQKITIVNGDIYLDNKVLRRPQDVEDSMLYTIYDSNKAIQPIAHFSGLKDDAWDTSMNRWYEENGVYQIDGEKDTLIFVWPIDSRIESHMPTVEQKSANLYNPVNSEASIYKIGSFSGKYQVVGDIEFQAMVNFTKAKGVLDLKFEENDIAYRIELNPELKLVKVFKQYEELFSFEKDIDFSTDIFVRFRKVDCRITVQINEELKQHEYELQSLRYQTSSVGLKIYSNETFCSVKNVMVKRDIHYVGSRAEKTIATQKLDENGNYYWDLGEDDYLFLGDNVHQSSDSRDWGVANSRHIKGKAMYVLMPLRIWPGDNYPPWLPFLSHRTRCKAIR